jgi:hypothetical protein
VTTLRHGNPALWLAYVWSLDVRPNSIWSKAVCSVTPDSTLFDMWELNQYAVQYRYEALDDVDNSID